MKTILMTLALGLLAYTGTDAQICKCKTATTTCKTAVRHKTVHRTTMPLLTKVQTTETAQSCRAIPFQACTINSNRRSVTCYETTDLDNLTPLNDNVTTYGSTGPIPGEPMQTEMKTVVVKNNSIQTNTCKYLADKKETVCTVTGQRLERDPFGYYYYR